MGKVVALAQRSKKGGIANPWAPRIQAALRRSVEGVLEAGRLLAKAKADLPHDEFVAMVERDLGLGLRSAQRLIRIGSDKRLTTHVSSLPSGWGTLYQIALLDDRTFERRVKDGTIRPNIERREAAGLIYKAKRVERIVRAASQNVGVAAHNLLYCDAPWPRDDVPYQTMSLERIRSLRLGPDGKASKSLSHPTVSQAVAPCAAIGCWAVEETVDFCRNVLLPAWGFEPLIPTIIWHKQGHARAASAALMTHEHFVIGVRGDARPTWLPRSVISVQRSRVHSQKPGEFRAMLAKMFPLLVNRLELFARRRVPNWDGWGAQYPAE